MASIHGALGSNAGNLASIHSDLASGGLPAGGGSALSATVSGSAPPPPAASSGSVSFAGQGHAEQVVGTSTELPGGGGVTLNLVDGSSINVLGTTHIDGSLFHK